MYQCYVHDMYHSMCVDICLCFLPSSLSQCSQQLESGWREQGAGFLHASFYWRGNHAPCPTQVLPTRYFSLFISTVVVFFTRC